MTGETRAIVPPAPDADLVENPPYMMSIYWWACGAHAVHGTASSPLERDLQIENHVLPKT